MLTFLVILPLLASGLVLLFPSNKPNVVAYFTLAVCIAELLLTIFIATRFDAKQASYQLLEQADWISFSLGNLGSLSIDYLVGIDGFSMPMLLLSSVVFLVAAGSSWHITNRTKGYFSLFLLLLGSVMGCFIALDFFLFFLFFEFMLLPMYFLIGLWGGTRREYAAIKFFIYTLIGSVLILVVMIALYLSVIDPVETAQALGMIRARWEVTPSIISEVQQLLASGNLPTQYLVHTFDLRFMTDTHNFIPNTVLSPDSSFVIQNISLRTWAFIVLFTGFAIKLPVVPLHTWLPDAHVEAPTPISVILAGILLKIGGYGIIRVGYGIFSVEAQQLGFWIGLIGATSIVYAALNALAQNDFKRLIAYSSVSHMGFVLLGLASFTPEGWNGAVFQMVSHGILAAMLFLLVGVLYDRTHDRQISNYTGLAMPMPNYAVLTGIAFFASLGLPAFSGFVGEFFSLLGAFNSSLPKWIVMLGGFGIILSAGYFLWTLQRLFFGKLWTNNIAITLPDLTLREKILLIPLALLTFILGILPQTLVHFFAETVSVFLRNITT